MNVPPLITYPARPIKGGRLELAPPKRGLWHAEPKIEVWRALINTLSGTMLNRLGALLTNADCLRPALWALAKLASYGLVWADSIYPVQLWPATEECRGRVQASVPQPIPDGKVVFTLSLSASREFTKPIWGVIFPVRYTPMLYQWQRNGLNIAGATGASYTFPSPALADHGAQFTCIVSNYGGTTTAAAATLSVFATPFEVWRFNHFGTNLNTGNAADDADPDGDGIKNLLEFTLSLDPLVCSTAFLPLPVREGAFLTLTYTRPSNLGGISLTAQATADLAVPLSSDGVTEELLSDNGTTRTVKAKRALATETRAFMRLQAAP